MLLLSVSRAAAQAPWAEPPASARPQAPRVYTLLPAAVRTGHLSRSTFREPDPVRIRARSAAYAAGAREPEPDPHRRRHRNVRRVRNRVLWRTLTRSRAIGRLTRRGRTSTAHRAVVEAAQGRKGTQTDRLGAQQLQPGLARVRGQPGGEPDHPEPDPPELCRAPRTGEEVPARRTEGLVGDGREAPEEVVDPGLADRELAEFSDPVLDTAPALRPPQAAMACMPGKIVRTSAWSPTSWVSRSGVPSSTLRGFLVRIVRRRAPHVGSDGCRPPWSERMAALAGLW